MIAALYVETDGVYFGLEGVDPWDEHRDARAYAGPHPVVAHPPCQRWSCSLAPQIETMHGYAVGDDGGCFAHALSCVERFGGVLEHPAHSIAWDHFGLPKPSLGAGWVGSFIRPGWSAEIEQGHYGHDLAKPTWLYVVSDTLPALEAGRSNGRRDVFNHSPLSEQERRKLSIPTPPAFRDILLELARSSSRVQAVA